MLIIAPIERMYVQISIPPTNFEPVAVKLKGSASNLGSTSSLEIEYEIKNKTNIPTIPAAVISKLFGSSKDLISGKIIEKIVPTTTIA